MTGPTPYGPPVSPGGYGKERTHMSTDAEYYEQLATPTLISATDVIAHRIYTRRDAALFHVNACTDAGHNAYWGVMELIGNSTRFLTFLTTAAGETLPLPTVVLPGIDKGDSVRMHIGGADGRSLLVWWSAHEAIAGERDNSVLIAEIPGVVRVPYPQGSPPEGGAFDPRALGGAVEPSEPVDYTRIQTMLNVAANRTITDVIAAFGQEGVRLGIMHKVMDAAGALFDKDADPLDPRVTRFLDLLAPFVRDRSYEGCLAALEAAGLYTPPKKETN